MNQLPRQAELLRRHGIRLDKKLGQHFLVDARVRRRIVDEVGALGPERVVELASGAGSLTFELAARGWPIHALELDPQMIEVLEAERGARDITVERCDLARTDFGRFVDGRRLVFVGNLPYQVTSPILFALRDALEQPSVAGAVIMVQNEVARRLAAEPGTRESGILTVLLQARLEVRRRFVVKPGCFLPPPAVDSAVVRLRRREHPVAWGDSGERLVRLLFGERRKQIGGLLRRAMGLTEEQVAEVCRDAQLASTARAEELGIEEFARLDRELQRIQAGDASQ